MAFPEKPAKTDTPIDDLIAKRWSPRAMDGDRDLERDQILALLEAARWAPSCFGDEPWRFIAWDRGTDPAGWQRAQECLADANRAWAKRAPLLIAVCADSEFRKNGKANRWAQYDCGAAAENLCLQAVSMDLAVHQMGGFDQQAVREAFDVPDRYTPMAMIAVGYPGDPEDLPEEKRGSELGDRSRRPLDENFFGGHWGRSLDKDEAS